MSETWMIDKAPVSAGVARLLAYQSTSGAEGIAKSNHMAVRQMGAATGQVRILPGAVTVLNRSPNVWCESYFDRMMVQETVPITATGSGAGRSDLIVRRIEDPDFPPWPAMDEATRATAQFGFTRVIEGVPPTTKKFTDLGLSQSAVALARIDIPASTAAITDAMITDLRQMSNPKSKLVQFAVPNVTGDTGLVLNNNTTGEWFPNANGPQSFDIPDWATYGVVECFWEGVKYFANTNPWGAMWVGYGPSTGGSLRERNTQKFGFDCDGPHASNQRVNWIVKDDVYIPASYRGTSQMFVPTAAYSDATATPAAGSRVTLDAYSGMALSVQFRELPDPNAT